MAKCACQDQDEIVGSPDRVVTIVHGTYGRHAEWMQDGEPLPEALLDQLSGQTALRRFCWRGRNRHTDRAKAGADLEAELKELVETYPAAEHHVIAHSHGGNVAMYAVGNDDGALSDVRVTTLGTPFLSMVKRPVSRGLLALALFGSAVFLGNLLQWVFAVHEYETSSVAGLWLLYYSSASAIAVVAGLLLLISSFMYRRSTESGWLSLLRGRPVGAEAVRVSSPTLDDERLFVVRAQGDEAAALLGAGQLGSFLLRKALALGRSKATKWIVGLALVAIILGPEEGTAAEVIAWIAVGPMIAISMAAFLLAFAYLPFGIDMLFWTMHAAVTASPSPQGYTAGFQAGSPGDDDGLAHSVYHDPEVIDVVVAQIETPQGQTAEA